MITQKRDNDGRLHADDSPAVTHVDGSWAWFKHGALHRSEGPAVRLVLADGTIEEQFWFAGREIK